MTQKKHKILSKIIEFYGSNRTTKAEMESKTIKLFHFIDTHARKIHCHLEIFKCGKIEYTFCKPIMMPKLVWGEISKRPRFLPLPEPINIESWEENKDSLKHKSFNKLKYKETHEKCRPSNVQITKSDSERFKEKNQYNISLTKSTEPDSTKKLPNSLQYLNSARYTINYENCIFKNSYFHRNLKEMVG